MYYVLGIVILAVIGFVLYNRSSDKKHVEKVVEYERKDAALEAEIELTEQQIEELEHRLEKVEDDVRDMNPEEIENYWNKKWLDIY